MLLFEKLKTHYPFFILGPCVIESEENIITCAEFVKSLSVQYPDIQFIFKSSFDKANRNSIHSYRGPQIELGLKILTQVGKKFNFPILTDIHTPDQAEIVAEFVDIIQIPAFLCRQTDMLVAAARTNCIVNIKKGQFLDPDSMKYIIEKIESAGNRHIILTERGTTFGYQNLVVDYRGLVIMKQFGYPVVFDATHSVQKPGGLGAISGGDSVFAPYLARAAASIPVHGFFFEIHPNPDQALSDSANMLNFETISKLIPMLLKIHHVVTEY